MARRVVVTGIGCVSPLGVGRVRNWTRLLAGECGVRRLEALAGLPAEIAAPVPRSPDEGGFDASACRLLSRVRITVRPEPLAAVEAAPAPAAAPAQAAAEEAVSEAAAAEAEDVDEADLTEEEKKALQRRRNKRGPTYKEMRRMLQLLNLIDPKHAEVRPLLPCWGGGPP